MVVSDWTSSMYPYTAQLLIWAMSAPQAKIDVVRFVFFNDGDQKEDADKVLGAAGGIYHSKSNSLEDAFETMKVCATNGKGGDIPENNIEAILEAIATYKEAERILMIADNSADVRDIQLLDKISKPVHIILGRSKGFPYINTHYMEIAIKTKGSLHTANKDYEGDDLQALMQSVQDYHRERKKKKAK